MGRMYSIQFDAIALTGAADLFAIQPASNKPVVLHEVIISQSSDTDSEQIRITIKRLTPTVTIGSGGAAVTPTPLTESDTAAGATCRRTDTTRASTTGATKIIVNEAVNVLNGFHYLPTPEMRPTFVNGEAAIVGLENAPIDSLTFHGTAIFEEIG